MADLIKVDPDLNMAAHSSSNDLLSTSTSSSSSSITNNKTHSARTSDLRPHHSHSPDDPNTALQTSLHDHRQWEWAAVVYNHHHSNYPARDQHPPARVSVRWDKEWAVAPVVQADKPVAQAARQNDDQVTSHGKRTNERAGTRGCHTRFSFHSIMHSYSTGIRQSHARQSRVLEFKPCIWNGMDLEIVEAKAPLYVSCVS